jgi:ribosomal protein S27AE
MKDWIIIEGEHCPKCLDGMVMAFCYKNEDRWRGGEKLKCTQNKCNLTGKVVPKGKVFDCEYDS